MLLRLSLVLLLAQVASSEPAQSNNFDAAFRDGLLALQRNDIASAQQDLKKAVQLNPQSSLAWAALGQAYLRGKQTQLATEAVAHAEKLGASDPLTEHSLTIFYSESGDYAKAAAWERRFAASPKADPQAAYRAAGLSLDAAEPDQAIAWAKKALDRQDTADARHLLATAYEAAKQPDAAFEEFRKAAQLAPDNATYAFDFGNRLLHRGKFPEAVMFFDQARRRFPKSAQMELAYGVAAYGARRFSDSIASFLQVIQLDPTVEQPYVFMGRILNQGGDRMPQIVAAYAAWEKANPGNYLAPLLHAEALSASNGDPSVIEAELRRSLDLNGAYWETHLQMGMLLSKKHQWQTAANEFARAVELNPKEPRAHFELARMYDRLGEHDKAEAERAIHERLTAADTGATPNAAPVKEPPRP